MQFFFRFKIFFVSKNFLSKTSLLLTTYLASGSLDFAYYIPVDLQVWEGEPCRTLATIAKYTELLQN